MHFTAFDDKEALAKWMADNVSANLQKAINENGRANLAVSGGSTPLRFFRMLSKTDIEWENVWVTLVDERWVPPSSKRSNQRLVTLELLQQNAAKAHLIGLYREGLEAQNISEIEEEFAPLVPFDVVVLGMGSDGHTASLFPGGDNLSEATRDDLNKNLTYMNAPDAGETRVTMTVPAITSAKNLLLHIEGREKRDVLEDALEDGDPTRLPIRFILNKCPKLRVVWAP